MLALACCTSAHAEDGIAQKGNTFELGTVVVQGKKSDQPPAGESAITREQLDQLNRETVGEAPLPLPPAWR
ncbi:hypothetical protein [Thermomonas beijingensis]|uniref:hypothetical protein n=1 Tax=Thermomonas beijingensis TaxID=2872701 RepID=UPI001CC12B63|nr:hypothetical protein [Thermomonas beijingensis]